MFYNAILIMYNIKKGDNMAKKRMTFTLDEELLVELKNISNKSMIPQAKIVQAAIKEYLKKMSL